MATEFFREFILSKGNYYSQIKKFRELINLNEEDLNNHLLTNYSMLELVQLLTKYIKTENGNGKIPKIRITKEQFDEYFTFGRDEFEIICTSENRMSKKTKDDLIGRPIKKKNDDTVK